MILVEHSQRDGVFFATLLQAVYRSFMLQTVACSAKQGKRKQAKKYVLHKSILSPYAIEAMIFLLVVTFSLACVTIC